MNSPDRKMGEPVESRPPPPTWINENFVEKALRCVGENKDLSVDSITVHYANKDGSGFASQMYRVTTLFRRHENDQAEKKSLVIKISHDAGELRELADNLKAFRIESLVLYEVMPQIHKILNSVEGDKFLPFAAKCISYGNEPTDYIVMEDLVASGFRLADSGKPLDLEHCLVAYRTYGRLHAASAFLLKQEPKYHKLLAKDGFVENLLQGHFGGFMPTVFLAVANELKKHSGYEKYSEKYTNSPELVHRVVEVMKKQREVTKLTILTHGDCWKNNMMFKYSGDQIDEIRLVDFQLTCTNSPVRDLLFFLYANASLEVHRDHLDTLLAEYHSTLVATLRALGMHDAADEYPLEQLKKDMDDYLMVGVLFTAMSGFVLTAEKLGPDFLKNFGDESKFGEVMERSCDNPYSPSYLKYQTVIFESKGLL